MTSHVVGARRSALAALNSPLLSPSFWADLQAARVKRRNCRYGRHSLRMWLLEYLLTPV
jgi:hypothetical protein